VSQSETNRPGSAALADIYLRIGNSQRGEFRSAEWDSLVIESNRLLKIAARHTHPVVADRTAHSLANIIGASNSLGISFATRNAAIIQSVFSDRRNG
jgi:hypothetical protein